MSDWLSDYGLLCGKRRGTCNQPLGHIGECDKYFTAAELNDAVALAQARTIEKVTKIVSDVTYKVRNQQAPEENYLGQRLSNVLRAIRSITTPAIQAASEAHDKKVYERGVADGIESVARSRTNNE